MPVLELGIEAFEDLVELRGGLGGEDLGDEVAVGLIPVEVGDLPEVSKAVAGLRPKLGEAGDFFGVGEIRAIGNGREGGIAPAAVLLGGEGGHAGEKDLPVRVGVEWDEVGVSFGVFAVAVAVVDDVV